MERWQVRVCAAPKDRARKEKIKSDASQLFFALKNKTWLSADMFRWILTCVTVASSLSLAQGKGANPYLSQAKVYYQDLEFERCLQRLSQAAKWESSTKEDAEVALYNGLCQLGLGKEKNARKDFEIAVRIDPTISLPAQQSPRVTGLFASVKDSLPAEKPVPKPVEKIPEEKPVDIKVVPKDAPKEVRLTPPPPNSIVVVPIVAAAPNRTVPIALGIAGGVALAAGVVLGILAQGKANEADKAVFESDGIRLGNEANALSTGANVSYIAGGALVVSGVVAWFVTGAPAAEPKPKQKSNK
jgi:hypothetical protein